MSILNGQVLIGTTYIKTKSYDVEIDSLATEDSGRSDNGAMEIDWIYNRIRKVSIVLPPMKRDKLSAILNLVQGQQYTMTYVDPIKGETTSTFYTSNCSTGLYYHEYWQDASFSAIEMAGEIV